MPVQGQDLVLRNLNKWSAGFVKHVNETMAQVAGMMDDQTTLNMSLRDHSLDDLRKLGHPYATRSPQDIHDPIFQIHEQSGNLLQSKTSGVDGADIDSGVLRASAWVKLDDSLAPYAAFIVYGTSKMIPRPVLMGSRDEVLPQITDFIKANLTNAKVSI